MATITANELKRRGVTSISDVLQNDHEATISVRGKEKYIVMDLEYYQFLRQCELESALLEARKDRETGMITGTSIADHITQLKIIDE